MGENELSTLTILILSDAFMRMAVAGKNGGRHRCLRPSTVPAIPQQQTRFSTLSLWTRTAHPFSSKYARPLISDSRLIAWFERDFFANPGVTFANYLLVIHSSFASWPLFPSAGPVRVLK